MRCARASAPGKLTPLNAQRFGLAEEQMRSILNDYWQVRCAADDLSGFECRNLQLLLRSSATLNLSPEVL